jgi:SAM-dependent methyltransferase
VRYDREQALAYWNDSAVESMNDKHLLNAEIELIGGQIQEGAKILDAGCGEGEGTLAYSAIAGTVVHAVDFSETRLQKARRRLRGRPNVICKLVDFLGQYELDSDYDVVISQRFLINLTEWRLQQQVLLGLASLLRAGGRLVVLEGSRQGVASLNEFRAAFGLEPIPVRWHNLFLDDGALIDFMREHRYRLVTEAGLGSYFLLTRGVRPMFDQTLNWDCEFNRLAAASRIEKLLGLGSRFSRQKLWVFEK